MSIAEVHVVAQSQRYRLVYISDSMVKCPVGGAVLIKRKLCVRE